MVNKFSCATRYINNKLHSGIFLYSCFQLIVITLELEILSLKPRHRHFLLIMKIDKVVTFMSGEILIT